MKYDFDRFIDRSGTNSVKWEFMKDNHPDVPSGTIPMWIADMDFPCARPILDALHDRVDKEIFGYSSNETEKYYRAVCGWYQHRFGWFVSSRDVFFGPGVVPSIGYLIALLTAPGDGVVIQPPVYYPFARMIRTHGRTIVENPLCERDGYYTMDYDDLEKKVSAPNTHLMILCSPHNPVGRVWKEEELKKVVEICKRHDVNIISDEIHFDFVRQGHRHLPLSKVCPEYKDHIFTATAPSKTFNLAGMQLSNIVIHNSEIQRRWSDYIFGLVGVRRPTALAVTATQAAYEQCEEWVEQANCYIDANMDLISQFFTDHLPEARFFSPEGTYFAWVNLSGYGVDHERLDQMLLMQGRVLTEDGILFGNQGEGYIRLNAACPRQTLEESLRRISGVLNKA